MQDWIINLMDQYGYLGIALLIAIENVFPPIPSELILTFGGFMTTYTSMNIWLVALFATIGSVFGAIILYCVGKLVPMEKLEWIVGKWGHILGLKKGDLRRAVKWFNSRGSVTIFFCRFIPIVRSLISIPAGMTRMRMVKFIIFTTCGTAIWNIVLVWLGALAGAGWRRIAEYVDTYKYIALSAVAVAAIVFIILFKKKRNLVRFNTQNED